MSLQYGPYSPSRLDTATCGYAFHKQYIDPARKSRPKQENLPQARGGAVHEVLEEITKILIADKNAMISGVQIQNWVAAAVNRHPASYEETADIIEMAQLYVRRPPPLLTPDAETELRLAVKMVTTPNGVNFEECHYDDPQAFARGRADILLITDDLKTARVYDHKTQPNVEEADTAQMGFYAWVLSKYYRLETVETILHFARYGYYSEPYVWSKERLAQVEDVIMTNVQSIENRTQWVATPHKNCQYCPFILECPAWKEHVQLDATTGTVRFNPTSLHILGDAHRASMVAGVVNVLEEVLSIAKEEVREFCKGNKLSVAIPGKVYEYRPTAGINWDKANTTIRGQVLEVFKKHNVDPMMFMGFSQTFSKSIWMVENEALIKELADILPKKVETKFAGYKV